MIKTLIRLGGSIASITMFVLWFEPGRAQWSDALWLVALALWVAEVRARTGGSLIGVRVSAAGAAPIAVFVLLFAAAWLPFYDNWRWAYTGDSVAWFIVAEGPARNGLGQSILSLHGVDGNFSFLHGLAFNSLLFVFEPTLFWHRVGKLIVSCLSLIAMYAYFTVALSRWVALAIAVCTATNYVWLWFSYVSYAHIDSHIFYFLTLILATLIWRTPDRLGLWVACGLLGGLSLFFTQTAWSAVALVGGLLTLYACMTRRFAALALYAVSFLLAATPVLLQFSTLLDMITRQAKPIYEWDYLRRTFLAILYFPVTSDYRHIGVNGGFMRTPIAESYVIGLLVAVLGVVPALRHRLRIPALAPLLLGLFLYEALLMTATNNGYPLPSTKRVYNIIPLENFFAILPFYVLYQLTARWQRARTLVVSLAVVAIAVAAYGSWRRIALPTRGMYGTNSYDALIEMRQRFPDRHVILMTSRPDYEQALAPDAFFNQAYRLCDRVEIEHEFADAVIERGCREKRILCMEPNFDEASMRPLLERHTGLRSFALLNTQELACYECTDTPLN